MEGAWENTRTSRKLGEFSKVVMVSSTAWHSAFT